MSQQVQPSFNLPSPIHKVSGYDFGFSLDVKREDLIHPLIKGNKYRKLKYNLAHYFENKFQGIITFGGAYSNHLHATAALGKLYGIPTVGIVRGEEFQQNELLSFCKNAGMVIHQVTRSAYKEKENHDDISEIIFQYPNHLLIPEGGSNNFAIDGVSELVDEFTEVYDIIAVAAGTGCTAASIIKRIDELDLPTRVIVFSALKGEWMQDEVAKFLGYQPKRHLITDRYCLGGYACTNDAYLTQLDALRAVTQVPIDHVYNGKVLIGLIDLLKQGRIGREQKVLWINSGGVV